MIKSYIIIICLFCVTGISSAQEYKLAEEYVEGRKYRPTAAYPYLLEEFTEGTAYHKKGANGVVILNKEKFNIFLCDSKLHYISKDDGNKYECIVNDIDSVVIDYTLYICYDDVMLEAVGRNNGNMVLKRSFVKDLHSFPAERGNVAYRVVSKINENKELNIVNQYYLYINGVVIDANKKAIVSFVDKKDNKKIKEFIKLNNIKWKEENSLIRLLNYFNK